MAGFPAFLHQAEFSSRSKDAGWSLRAAADVFYEADVGRQMRSRRRQSIPSGSIDNWAWGQGNDAAGQSN